MVTDLIARLEATDSVAHSDVCGCPGWFPPEYTTCRIAALLENLPAILRALKVQEAAEEWEPLYQTVTYGEAKIADHKKFEQAERALAAAVKGEQG